MGNEIERFKYCFPFLCIANPALHKRLPQGIDLSFLVFRLFLAIIALPFNSY